MEWGFIVALVLVVPIILIPAALVWYLNVSGLYRVMRDARQREKRRARALRGAGVVGSKAVIPEAAPRGGAV